MFGHLSGRPVKKKHVSIGGFLAAIAGLVVFAVFGTTYGAQQLQIRSLQLSNSLPSATSNYLFGFTLATSGTLGSIRIQICSNDPLIGTACTAPGGYNLSSALLASQTGETGFSISPLTTSNVLILTRPAALSSTQPVTYTLSGVTNPNSTGSYYARIQTYASTDATGSDTDYGGLAFSISSLLTVNAEVPPYLTFCAGVQISSYNCNSAAGSYLNLGTPTASNTARGQSQLLASTNAANGYNITISGDTLTSGNNVIKPIASSDVSRPNTSQFGINLTSNNAPTIGSGVDGPGSGAVVSPYGTANFFKYLSGDTIAASANADDYRRYTVSYIANAPSGQPAGIYVSTYTYTCFGNF